MNSKTLMVVGHPHWQYSVANKAIVEAYKELVPDVQISNVIIEYPDFKIDVEAEQQKLIDADNIILQFPFMWYGAPSIMHRWFEEVLAYGFAFGHGGDKLEGKRLFASFTTGTPEESYKKGGLQSYPLSDFMPPFIALANRCGMQWGGEVHTCGINTIAAFQDPAIMQQIKQECLRHANILEAMVKGI